MQPIAPCTNDSAVIEDRSFLVNNLSAARRPVTPLTRKAGDGQAGGERGHHRANDGHLHESGRRGTRSSRSAARMPSGWCASPVGWSQHLHSVSDLRDDSTRRMAVLCPNDQCPTMQPIFAPSVANACRPNDAARPTCPRRNSQHQRCALIPAQANGLGRIAP
jgi:hypothetical protein